MTNAEFEKSWEKYGVKIDGTVKPIKNFFMLCWGPVALVECDSINVPGMKINQAVPDRDNPDAPLMFDTGGEQGDAASCLFTVIEGVLWSVSEGDPQEKRVIGELVLLDE